jgi:hypothetical protein
MHFSQSNGFSSFGVRGAGFGFAVVARAGGSAASSPSPPVSSHAFASRNAR